MNLPQYLTNNFALNASAFTADKCLVWNGPGLNILPGPIVRYSQKSALIVVKLVEP